jgi:cation diffusion facilitator family transporter
MAEEQSKIAIIAALATNIGEVIIKLIAALVTGSAAMFSEAAHSLVDTANDILLVIGMHRSKKPADTGHPFGYGKEVYFWTLVVSLLIFILGGGLSVYEGIFRLLHPGEITNPSWNYIVLGVSLILEIISFSIALRKFNKESGNEGFWSELHQSKDPSLFAVIYDDAAAILGIVIAFAGIFLSYHFNDSRWDGIASILIGIVICIAAAIMVIESKNLLVGESARPQMVDGISTLVNNDPAVVRLRAPLTMQMSPTEILLAIDVEFAKEIEANDLTKVIKRLERNIRLKFPDVKKIFIEARNLSPLP